MRTPDMFNPYTQLALEGRLFTGDTVMLFVVSHVLEFDMLSRCSHRVCSTSHEFARQANKAADEAAQDSILYDGEQQRYLQLLANGGADEVPVDASDIDSSDVSSSLDASDVDSDDEDEPQDKDTQKRMPSASERPEKEGPRGRHPLLTEISSKSERRRAATERWFNNPLFAGVDVDDSPRPEAEIHFHQHGLGDDETGQEGIQRPTKRPRSGGELREKSIRETAKEEEELSGAAAELLAAMPKTDKEKRKEKRRKVSIETLMPRSSGTAQFAFERVWVSGLTLPSVLSSVTGSGAERAEGTQGQEAIRRKWDC